MRGQKMRNLAILVPSRNRPQNIVELMDSLEKTKTESDLIVIVDDDDVMFDSYLATNADIFMVERRGKGMAKPLNFVSNHLKDKYRHFAFLGDDHRPRTEHWDVEFINHLDELETGLVYGNDLLQGEHLATAVGMSGNIVKALGGMTPPNMIHLYLDNFWMKLGNDLGALRYLPNVVIEHLHPIAGKAEWDEGYRAVNAEDVYSADEVEFWKYIQSDAYRYLLEELRDQS
jgi:glycosyltransferase involved in cell wall biosynthesis